MPNRAIAVTAALLTASALPPAEGASESSPEHRPVPGIDDMPNLVLPPRPAAARLPSPPPGPPPPAVVPGVSPRQSKQTASRAPAPARRIARSGDILARIRACESGGNYAARSSSGRYGGAYQFDRKTFASVGGRGDPATAPRAEQDYRARLLYQQRGTQAWPVCASRA